VPEAVAAAAKAAEAAAAAAADMDIDQADAAQQQQQQEQQQQQDEPQDDALQQEQQRLLVESVVQQLGAGTPLAEADPAYVFCFVSLPGEPQPLAKCMAVDQKTWQLQWGELPSSSCCAI
jgi:hypothetical protein